MSFVVNENASSLAALHRQSRTTQALDSNVAKLSSGQRINNASDDAPGLGIDESLKQRASPERAPDVLGTRGIDRYRAIAALRAPPATKLRDTD